MTTTPAVDRLERQRVRLSHARAALAADIRMYSRVGDEVVDGPVTGWRVFALGDDGRLAPPFAAHFWPDRLSDDDALQPGRNEARCLATLDELEDGQGEHEAPGIDCTCGIRVVENLKALIAACRTPFGGSTVRPIDAGVFARLRVSGRILSGYRMPYDDPRTTVRGQYGELVEVWLAPHIAELAPAVRRRYGVPVHLPTSVPT